MESEDRDAGTMKQVDLKKQLLTIVLKAIMFFSITAIIVNLITRLPLGLNIKWLVLFVTALGCILYDRYRGLTHLMKFIYCLFLVAVVMPLGFIDAGGTKGDTIAYTFFALIMVTYLFDGSYRNTLIATIIFAFMGTHVYGYSFPEEIPVYNVESRFLDRLIQVPIIMLLSFLVVRRFADAYYQANKSLIQHAHYDELTGLLNRRNFNSILQRQLDSNNHNGYLIMMDVDNFKLINDQKGHLAGDDSLKYLSTLLRQYFDDGQNMISRWGGDEFIIIYFGDAGKLESILEKVKKDFRNYIKPIEPLVDISFGVAPLEGCQKPIDVLAKSDQIMYEKKKVNKRNLYRLNRQ